jgi:cell division protein FtsB
VFEAGAQLKLEANLKKKFNLENAPLLHQTTRHERMTIYIFDVYKTIFFCLVYSYHLSFLTGNEKSQLEKVRSEMNEQLEGLQSENEKLQAANTELQRMRDNLEDEKEDVTKAISRKFFSQSTTYK